MTQAYVSHSCTTLVDTHKYYIGKVTRREAVIERLQLLFYNIEFFHFFGRGVGANEIRKGDSLVILF